MCGIAVNEVEGLLRLNITAAEMVQLLKQDICSYFSGQVQQVCLGLAQKIPYIVTFPPAPNNF